MGDSDKHMGDSDKHMGDFQDILPIISFLHCIREIKQLLFYLCNICFC